MIRHLHREQFVPGDPARIWEFFSAPHNLDTITPSDLRFRIIGDVAPRMYPGQMIEYRIGILPGARSVTFTKCRPTAEGMGPSH